MALKNLSYGRGLLFEDAALVKDLEPDVVQTHDDLVTRVVRQSVDWHRDDVSRPVEEVGAVRPLQVP